MLEGWRGGEYTIGMLSQVSYVLGDFIAIRNKCMTYFVLSSEGIWFSVQCAGVFCVRALGLWVRKDKYSNLVYIPSMLGLSFGPFLETSETQNIHLVYTSVVSSLH